MSRQLNQNLLGTLFLFLFLIPFKSPVSLFAQSKPKKEVKNKVQFSRKGGFYSEPLSVELHALPGSKIFYTVNGDHPARGKAKLYRKPIQISKTTVIRAFARKGRKMSKKSAQTYFIDEPKSNFPVVSIAIPPYVLFNAEDGLFMKGNEVIDSLWKKPGANFWSKVEVPVHMQFFESSGKSEFNSMVGFRLFGGMSRLFPQKSFSISTRNRYGKKHLKHPVFGKDHFKKFKHLVFRNSGSDFGRSHFRDGLMTGLVKEWDLETQDFKPSHVYINGKYWGIYNIREKINRHYLAAHHEVHKDSLSLLEHRVGVKVGKASEYKALLRFIEHNDLSKLENYQFVQEKMDVDNFISYQIAQIYFDNRDAGGNIRFWKADKADAKWRWILYDTDWGFGLHDSKAYKKNSLAFFTETNGPKWPNPPWSTFLLRNLLKNETFRHKFITQFTDHLNESFKEEIVLKRVDEHYQQLKPEINRHLKRWRRDSLKWEEDLATIRHFAQTRPKYIRKYLNEAFELGEEVKLEISGLDGGRIFINEDLEINYSPFQGIYFQNIPVQLTAIPNKGYRFVKWEGISKDSLSSRLTINFSTNRIKKIKAIFEKYEHPLAGQVFFNEISCNNKSTKDWIELYNYSDEEINMKNWVLTDKNHEFRFPDVNIAAKDYLIICEDSTKFFNAFPKAYNVVGGLPFGLDKKHEVLGLYSADAAFIDSFRYEVLATDSIFTMSLLLPWLDNSSFDNWEILKGFGSPNEANPYYVQASISIKQELWTQIGIGLAVFVLALFMFYLKRKGIL